MKDDAIPTVLKQWPADWCASSDLTVGSTKSIGKKKKEEAQSKIQQLAEKWKKEGEEKS